MENIQIQQQESRVAAPPRDKKHLFLHLRTQALAGDIVAAELLAREVAAFDGEAPPTNDGLWIADAVRVAVHHPWMWTGERQPLGIPSTVSPEDIRRVVIEAARARIHMQRPASINDYLSVAVEGFDLLVSAAMRAHKKGAWSLWCKAWGEALVEAHHEDLKRTMRSRDRKEPERTAWTRHATALGVNSAAVDVIEIATRKGVACGELTVDFVVAAMRAEIAEMQAAQAKYSSRPDPRLPKLLSLMEQYPTGLAVEAAWRLKRRKRIEDHRAECKMLADNGTLKPIAPPTPRANKDASRGAK